MKTVVMRKYISGRFVETYEATFEVPDDVEDDDVSSFLEDQLDDADWEQTNFDDTISEVEYEVHQVDGEESSED